MVELLHNIYRAARTAACLTLFICLLTPVPVAAEPPQEAEPKTFPGINEIIPRATALAAKASEANTQIPREESRNKLYARLEVLSEVLKKLEERYDNWEEADNWQVNRLLRAQAEYSDLHDQGTEPNEDIYNLLKTLENHRSAMDEHKTFWQEWSAYLRQEKVQVPKETFQRTLSSIDKLRGRINRVGAELIEAQQRYAPVQEIIVSRLSIIDETLDMLRRDTFRRNSFSMFDTDYYRQFNRKLLSDFAGSVATSLSLPPSFFQRHGSTVLLQIVGIIVISLLLIYRRTRSKPFTKEWGFLFQRPISGAVFITIMCLAIFTDLTRGMPLSWKWVSLVTLTIAAMRLLNAFYESPLAKGVIRVLAAVFLISESLRYLGLPVPLLQLYDVLLCALAIPACLYLQTRWREQLGRQRPLLYLMLGIAVVGLLAALGGNESFATNLLDATLTTFIIIIITQMALRLSDRGIEACMSFKSIEERHFMQVLGKEASIHKLQFLTRVTILFHSGLLLLVTWMLFDSIAEAKDVLSSYKYTAEGFTLSVDMVVMVIVVLYLTTVFSWVMQAFVDSQIMTPKKMDIGVKESLKSLTHYGLITIGFLIAISMAGIDLQKFTILAGALGVGIGFGLQNIVNNFVSGLILLFERPVKIGDTINIDQSWGTITKIGLRSTVFETFDRAEIIVPNADLISQKVTNWTFTSKVVRVLLPVGVAYGSPLQEVLGVLNRAAREHADVLTYPEPSTVFEDFGNSSINFTLRFWVHTIDDRMLVRTEVAVIVDRLLRENGIEIPFPQQDLHLRSVDSKLHGLWGVETPEVPQTADDPSATDTEINGSQRTDDGRKSSEVPQAADTSSESEGPDE